MLLDEPEDIILTTEIDSNDIPRSLGANFVNIPYYGHVIHLIFVYRLFVTASGLVGFAGLDGLVIVLKDFVFESN
jgi:hypothetical protein